MGREGDEAAAETVAGPHHDLRGPPVGEHGGGVGTGTGEEARPGDGPVRRQAPPRRLPGGERAPGVAVPVLPEGRGAGPLWAGPWPSAEGRHSAGSCVPVSGGQRPGVRAAGSGAGRAGPGRVCPAGGAAVRPAESPARREKERGAAGRALPAGPVVASGGRGGGLTAWC